MLVHGYQSTLQNFPSLILTPLSTKNKGNLPSDNTVALTTTEADFSVLRMFLILSGIACKLLKRILSFWWFKVASTVKILAEIVQRASHLPHMHSFGSFDPLLF